MKKNPKDCGIHRNPCQLDIIFIIFSHGYSDVKRIHKCLQNVLDNYNDDYKPWI